MIVLVRWCYNVDCHSVGRVPSSYPRGVRRPTALLCFLSYTFLSSAFVCLGNFCFGLFSSSPSSLSFLFFLFVSLCASWSRFRFPPPFMFMYCVKVFCIVFFLDFILLPYRTLSVPFALSPFFFRWSGVPRSVRFVCALLALHFRVLSVVCLFLFIFCGALVVSRTLFALGVNSSVHPVFVFYSLFALFTMVWVFALCLVVLIVFCFLLVVLILILVFGLEYFPFLVETL